MLCRSTIYCATGQNRAINCAPTTAFPPNEKSALAQRSATLCRESDRARHTCAEAFRQTIRETRDKSEKMLETGKQTFEKTKDFYEKSKDLYEKSKDFSKDIYDKSKELTKESSEFFKRKDDKPKD